ncbi:GNAT family N-acetyltransferase [Bacillus timonensis]|nr:GNAT family N-acetyltransferase [Bacillus timonensis]
MITIKRLSECKLEDVVTAWNRGFEGYFFNMTMNVERFLKRMVFEELSPRLSVVAFDEEEPVGVILNGIRQIDGKKVSWNGGTGVSKAYRGKGIGKKLMDAVLEIYKEESVSLATLEAVSENQRAIELYKTMGYEVVDDLVHFSHTGAVSFNEVGLADYQFEHGIPIDVRNLPFYQKMSSWQTQWNNARDGETILVKNQQGEIVGFALYKRLFNEDFHHIGTMLLQCEVSINLVDREDVMRLLLSKVFASEKEIQQTVANLPRSNEFLFYVLKEAGFEEKVEQVLMFKQM